MQDTSTFDTYLDNASERLLQYFIGFAKVHIRFFEYEVNDEENVRNYIQSFERNGCDRSNGEHYVSAVIEKDTLTRVMESQQLSINIFYDYRNPPLLQLTAGAKFRCVRGSDLLEAGQRYLPPGQRWWITKIYSSDIPSQLENYIRQNYSINEPASDEAIFRSFLMRCRSQDEMILNPKFGSDTDNHYVKKISQNNALRSAMKALAPYPGLWKDFTYRKLEYILAPRCDEEMIHYLSEIYNLWSCLFPRKLASLVDSQSVGLVEGRIPMYSDDDRASIEDDMKSGRLFPHLQADRDRVLKGLLSVSGRILTLSLLFHDALCLGPPAKAMREILPTTGGKTIKKIFLNNWRGWNGKCMVQLSEESFEEIPLGRYVDDVEGRVALLTLLQLWLVSLRYYISPRLGRRNQCKSMQPLLEIQGKGKLQKAAMRLGLQLDSFGQTLIRDPNLPVFQHVTGTISGELSGVGDARGAAFLSKRFHAIFMQPKQGQHLHQAPKLATNIASQKSSYRSGRPLQREYQTDRQFLFLKYMYCSDQETQLYPTSFAIVRDFFKSFFGRQYILDAEGEVSSSNNCEATDLSASVELDQRSESRYSSPDRRSLSPHVRPSGSPVPSEGQSPPQTPLGGYRLASVVSLPPHPAEIEEVDNEDLWAPGFEDQACRAPSKRRNKIVRQISAQQILSEWLQKRSENQDVVVFYLFKTHEYLKFRKQERMTIKVWLEDLAVGRGYYFLALDGDRLRTVEIEDAVTEAMKEGLLFVGDKSSFFVGDKSKELTQGISQSQLDDYLSQFDVITGKRKRGAGDFE